MAVIIKHSLRKKDVTEYKRAIKRTALKAEYNLYIAIYNSKENEHLKEDAIINIKRLCSKLVDEYKGKREYWNSKLDNITKGVIND